MVKLDEELSGVVRDNCKSLIFLRDASPKKMEYFGCGPEGIIFLMYCLQLFNGCHFFWRKSFPEWGNLIKENDLGEC